MSHLYLAFYRIYFLLDDVCSLAGARRITDIVRRRVLPKLCVLVRVQSGLSRGMWMRVQLPEEARYWRGRHECAVQDAVAAAVGPGDVVYDVGAHIGVVALGAARLVGLAGRVVAFDAEPGNATSLLESCRLNHLEDRLRVVNAAVWSYSARQGITFRRGGDCRSLGGVEADGYHPVLGKGEAITVPAIALDDFIRAGEPAPRLVKIDVEGGEYEVLQGGRQLFTSVRPLIIAEIHHRDALERITDWLERLRYDSAWEIPVQEFPRTLFAWPAEPASARFRRLPQTCRIVAATTGRTHESETIASRPPITDLQPY
jgi:FkbM family methyltransferase